MASFSSLNFMNIVIKDVLLKGEVQIGEEFFDLHFVEKFEEEFFKFVEITYKSRGKISEVERAGENIIKIFVNNSMQKLTNNIRKDERGRKIRKASIVKVVRPLGKEIAKATGQMLHQIIEVTTSKGNVQKKNTAVTVADLLKFFKNILSHMMDVMSDNSINNYMGKEAHSKFVKGIWQPIALDEKYDLVKPVEKQFREIFSKLLIFLKDKANETGGNSKKQRSNSETNGATKIESKTKKNENLLLLILLLIFYYTP
jgi:hypothetical protein